MPGPSPKPRDQRARRNKTEGTTSTTVMLPSDPAADWLDAWEAAELGKTVEVAFAVAGEQVNRRIPAPPGGMLKLTRQRWTAFWLSPESTMVRPHHMPALERLARLYDEEERLRRRVAKSKLRPIGVPISWDGPAKKGEAVVEHEVRLESIPGHLGVGSQGQLVVSPDFTALTKVRAEIRALEDRFAGSPMAEFRVGWQQAAMLAEQGRAREATQIAEAAQRIAVQHEQLRAGR